MRNSRWVLFLPVTLVLLLGIWPISGCKRERPAQSPGPASAGTPAQPAWLSPEEAGAEMLQPAIEDVQPADGAVISGREAWLRWRTNMPASSRLLWRAAGEKDFRSISGGSDDHFLLRVSDLKPGTQYDYHIEVIVGQKTARSPLRTFRVEVGPRFEPAVIEQIVARDYTQHLVLTLRNSTAKSAKIAARALKTYEELPADIVGPGSADQPAELPAGDALQLRLSVNAADARAGTYEIPIEAAGASAMVRVRIAQPKVKLALRVVKQDPHTLAQTLEIRNEGDNLTDLAVRVAAANASALRLQPDAKHARLPANGTVQIVAQPVLYLEFEQLSAELECVAAGQISKFPLSFKAPDGWVLTGFRTSTQERSGNNDSYCTNKPSTCSHVSGPGANGPESEPWSKMSFGDAAKPYDKAEYKYTFDGYVDKKGEVRNGGLACSQYASAVLHRMRYGDDWLSHYDLSVHQQYGDKIAGHFGLDLAGTFTSKTLLDKDETKKLIDECQLAPGLYFFNLRKGDAGHVGFVRVKADGSLRQSHYSGMSPFNGIASGDFRDWLKRSKYSKSDVELYRIPE